MSKEFKFLLLTDPHFYKNSLGAYGKCYDDRMRYEQKGFAETEAINRAVIEYLKGYTETDVILIAGDLSFNGEKESNREYSRLLHELKDSGKKIYVVTAGHDMNEHPNAYRGDDIVPVEGTKFSELLGFYHDFGYDTAIAFNEEHLSYVAQLADGIRLLVLCNDIEGTHNVAYDDEFRGWIKEQLDKAKADNQMIFAMEHYPVLPGQPILSFIGDARQKEAQKLVDLLADNGCHLIFTGHMHNQSINVVTTEKGNKFYDVCTGSLIGCPAYMRLCTIKDESTVDIKSIPIPHYDFDTKGKTCEQHLQDIFDGMIVNLLTDMRDDPERPMRKVGLKNTDTNIKLIRKVGTFVCEKTVGQTSKLFLVKAEPEVKDMKLLDLLASILRCAFCGDQPYTEDHPAGKTFLKIVRRFKPVLKIVNKKVHDAQGASIDIYDMIKNTIGNYGISDYDATLILK